MTVFLSTLAPGLGRASSSADGSWSVETVMPGTAFRALATDPRDASVVWAGTQGAGVQRSNDAGATWHPAGLDGAIVKSILVCPDGRIYAGVKPAAVWLTRDDGMTWTELLGFRKVRRPFWFSPAEPPFSPYVQGLAVEGQTVLAGIEAGAVVRSLDGGATWHGHRSGSLRDCHSLATAHGRFYEGGGTGGGAAMSKDGGAEWTRPLGHDRHYGWACAADVADPDLWYFSAAPDVRAHSDHADAAIYRCRGVGACERLGGGLPSPLNAMPYALLTGPQPGAITAGLSNGEVWRSADAGDHWQRVVTLPGVERSMVMLAEVG